MQWCEVRGLDSVCSNPEPPPPPFPLISSRRRRGRRRQEEEERKIAKKRENLWQRVESSNEGIQLKCCWENTARQQSRKREDKCRKPSRYLDYTVKHFEEYYFLSVTPTPLQLLCQARLNTSSRLHFQVALGYWGRIKMYVDNDDKIWTFFFDLDRTNSLSHSRHIKPLNYQLNNGKFIISAIGW